MFLSILLKILMIIGWILLGILALVILFLLIIFLVPVRYHADFHLSKKVQEIKAHGKASWLLHLLGINFSFENKKIDGSIRVAIKKISIGEEEESSKISSEITPLEATPSEPEKPMKEAVADRAPKKTADRPLTRSESQVRSESQADRQDITDQETDPGKEKNKQKKKKEKKAGKSRHSGRKKKPSFTFDSICDRINEIADAKDEILSFTEDSRHRKFLSHFLKRVKIFGHKLLPRKFRLSGELGFDDPYTSARVAALLAYLYPQGKAIEELEFNFQEEVCQLDGSIKGKLRLGSILAMIIPLLFDRNFYKTVKDAKKLKKDLKESRELIKGGKAA